MVQMLRRRRLNLAMHGMGRVAKGSLLVVGGAVRSGFSGPLIGGESQRTRARVQKGWAAMSGGYAEIARGKRQMTLLRKPLKKTREYRQSMRRKEKVERGDQERRLVFADSARQRIPEDVARRRAEREAKRRMQLRRNI